jgi:hypothetical protein
MKIKGAAIAVLALGSFLSACGTTPVVKLEENRYMVSRKAAKIGFVSSAEERAVVYRLANEHCAREGKEVKTLNLEERPSGFARQASATLEFECVGKSAE